MFQAYRCDFFMCLENFYLLGKDGKEGKTDWLEDPPPLNAGTPPAASVASGSAGAQHN